MTRLAETQERFLAALFDEAAIGARHAVYRRNVLANLHDALAAAYPVVQRLVGAAFFREAAERFSRAHPSRSGDLHRFGAELADFLASYPPAAALPYLPDLARLEWAVAQAFHAADADRLDFAALAAVPEAQRGGIRFRLHPAARLLASSYALRAIWEANQPPRDGTPEIDAGGDRVLVHREGFAVRVRSLAPVEWRFIEAVAAGSTLDAIAADEELAGALQAQLSQWTLNGVVAGFSASR